MIFIIVLIIYFFLPSTVCAADQCISTGDPPSINAKQCVYILDQDIFSCEDLTLFANPVCAEIGGLCVRNYRGHFSSGSGYGNPCPCTEWVLDGDEYTTDTCSSCDDAVCRANTTSCGGQSCGGTTEHCQCTNECGSTIYWDQTVTCLECEECDINCGQAKDCGGNCSSSDDYVSYGTCSNNCGSGNSRTASNPCSDPSS